MSEIAEAAKPTTVSPLRTYSCGCGAPTWLEGARCIDCLTAAIDKVAAQMRTTAQERQALEEAERQDPPPPTVEVVEVRSMNGVEARAAFRSIDPEALEYFRSRLMGTMDEMLYLAHPVQAERVRALIGSFLLQQNEAQR